ncbi:hypothetical protein ACFRJ9_17175 [Paenarthrobacter sp. NPDC056912]
MIEITRREAPASMARTEPATRTPPWTAPLRADYIQAQPQAVAA